MKYLLTGLRKYGVGRRALREEDFWQICADADIEVVWSRKKYPFFFTVPEDDIRCIVLPERFSGPRLLLAMFHELAHFWKDGGDEPCIAFQGLIDHKCEAEADAIALVALFPDPKAMMTELDFADSPCYRKLWKERQRLYFLYGI